MDLKQLTSLGAIAPRTLFKKDVPLKRPTLKPPEEWSDPNEPEFTGEIADDSMTVWVRKRSSADFLEMMRAPDRDKAHIAILRCICDAEGNEVFESVAQCKQLREWMFLPLMLVVNEVNEFGLKNSQPRTSSGAKSRSPSAARSRKRNRA